MRVCSPARLSADRARASTAGSSGRTCPARRKSPCRPGPCVAPSSMATSKSWLMPIDSSPSIDGRRRPRASSPSRRSRSAPELRPRVLGIVDRRRQQHQPDQPRPRAHAAAASKIAGSSSSARAVLGRFAGQVHLDQQLERPSGSRGRRVELAAAGRRCRSSECTSKRAPAFRALFDCRWPTRCQRDRRDRRAASIFCRASWTLFSPKSTLPGVGGGADVLGGKVFETATRRTAAGSRPARPAARAMRSRTSASRARSADGIARSGLLLQLRDERLRLRGVRAARARASGTSRTRSPRPASLPSFTSAMPSW